MKTIIKNFSILLVTAIIISGFTGCKDAAGKNNSESTYNNDTFTTEVTEEKVYLVIDGEAQYTIIRCEDAEDEEISIVSEVSKLLREKTGVSFKYTTDWVRSSDKIDSDKKEILIGYTNRPESSAIAEKIGYLGWCVTPVENKIVIYADTYSAYEEALDYFINTTLNGMKEEKNENGEVSYYIDTFHEEIKQFTYNSYLADSNPFNGLEDVVATTTQNDIDEILSSIKDADGRIISIAHRGNWRKYPENSLAAYQSCIDHGIDMVEIDLQKTKDGVWVICHDDTIDRTTNGKGKISEMTYAEISQYYLKSGKGGSTAKVTKDKMPTFEEVLELCRGKILLNLDKCWGNQDEIYTIAAAHNAVNICMFKGSSIANWAKKLVTAGKALPLLCGTYTKNDIAGFLSYIQGASGYAISIEATFSTVDAATADPDLWSTAKTLGMRGVGITIATSYSAGFTDDQCGWADLAEIGYSIIMTEYPLNLAAYIENISSIRSAAVPLRAENFNIQSGLSLKGDTGIMRGNKTVTGISCGDYAGYYNIDFGYGANTIMISARCIAESGCTVSVRLDNRDGDLLTVINVSKTDEAYVFAAEFEKIEGIHDVYLTFEGNAGELMRLEMLKFELT